MSQAPEKQNERPLTPVDTCHDVPLKLIPQNQIDGKNPDTNALVDPEGSLDTQILRPQCTISGLNNEY